MTNVDAEIAVEGLAEVWGSLVTLGRSLPDEAFQLPTECPGWSVLDQFSHVIGTELTLEGAIAPDRDIVEAGHVRNELGALNERFVDQRRGRPPREVVEELAAVTNRRLEALRSLDDEAWTAVGPTPVGMVPYSDFMVVRAFDSWVHEQDIRRAVGRPGGRGGIGERLTLDRMEASMAYVLGRRVGPPNGSTLRLVVSGLLGRIIQLEVALDESGRPRARSVQFISGDPTAEIRMDEETFVRRACGRIGPDEALAAAGTSWEGDWSLASAFVAEMVVMV
jgi:uncharacterized protein (TIGR03083 family)